MSPAIVSMVVLADAIALAGFWVSYRSHSRRHPAPGMDHLFPKPEPELSRYRHVWLAIGIGFTLIILIGAIATDGRDISPGGEVPIGLVVAAAGLSYVVVARTSVRLSSRSWLEQRSWAMVVAGVVVVGHAMFRLVRG